MGKWRDGKRAWERLAAWQRTEPAGDSALDALADVGRLRRVLDQVEMGAVRVARRHGKSWTEIATIMGVTRQSAWERWRDLDEPASQREPASAREMPTEVIERATSRLLSMRTWVVVPTVVGMSWEDARQALLGKRLAAVGSDPDAPPLSPIDWSHTVVTDQSPEAGAKVPAGSTVTLWTERGGGSGVREPRRPKPVPSQARGMRDDVSDEAIG
jgi:hypothetical protein